MLFVDLLFSRNLGDVDLDVESFMNEIASFMKPPSNEEVDSDGAIGEASSSDMDFGMC